MCVFSDVCHCQVTADDVKTADNARVPVEHGDFLWTAGSACGFNVGVMISPSAAGNVLYGFTLDSDGTVIECDEDGVKVGFWRHNLPAGACTRPVFPEQSDSFVKHSPGRQKDITNTKHCKMIMFQKECVLRCKHYIFLHNSIGYFIMSAVRLTKFYPSCANIK